MLQSLLKSDPLFKHRHTLHSLLKSAPMDKYLFLSSSSWKCVELGFWSLVALCLLSPFSIICSHTLCIYRVRSLCNSLCHTSHWTHVPPLLCIESVCKCHTAEGKATCNLFFYMMGGVIANSKAMCSGLHCLLQLLSVPSCGSAFTSDTHTHVHMQTHTYTYTYTHAQTDAGPSSVPPICSPTQSKFVYCNF